MASILDGLTRSELDILRMLAHGLTNIEIAQQRNCSQGGVKYHVGNILTKTGATSRTAAAVRYIREIEAIAPPTVVTRIVRVGADCPACAIRRLAASARNAGLTVTAVSDRGVRVATPRAPTGILLHDEQDLVDLCAELAEAA